MEIYKLLQLTSHRAPRPWDLLYIFQLLNVPSSLTPPPKKKKKKKKIVTDFFPFVRMVLHGNQNLLTRKRMEKKAVFRVNKKGSISHHIIAKWIVDFILEPRGVVIVGRFRLFKAIHANVRPPGHCLSGYACSFQSENLLPEKCTVSPGKSTHCYTITSHLYSLISINNAVESLCCSHVVFRSD